MAEEMKKEEHADADAGTTLDKVLSALDSMNKRMDALEGKKADAEESEEHADAEEMCDADEDEDEARDDADEEYDDSEEMADADEDDEEMEEFEDEPKHVAADKRRKDAEKAKADSAEIRKAIKRVEAMIPKQLSDADYAAMADAQAKADTVYMAFGDSAPRPLNGEDLLAYRRRLAKGLQKHSPKVKEINLSSIQDPTAFGVLEDMVYSDAMAAALAPADLPQGQLREIKSRDTTGRVISQFVGQPRSWMGGHTGNRRRIVGFRQNNG